ncbi:replication protein, partial [Bacillus mycoides]
MATFRVNKSKNYTTINNTGLRDERLSWKAKGILAYILSLPDDWVFYMEEISTHAKDGIDSLRVGMKELKKFGYVRRFPVKNEKGKITNWETIIYEVPQVENPHMKNPQVEVPFIENPILLSTKELSTNKQNTNIQSSSSIFSFYENNFGILNSFIAES